MKKKQGFDDVKLKLTGGSTGSDIKYLKKIKKSIRKEDLESQVDFIDEFEDNDRLGFFSQVTVISVPVRNGEAFGMYLLESMASGIPVLQPAIGAFPEIINLAGGGLIYEPNTPDALCEALATILCDPVLLNSLGLTARKGVEQEFNIHEHAKEMIEVYAEL